MEDIRCPSVVDVEASGFGNLSYPIEIGIAKSSGERYCALIRPDTKWRYWSNIAQQIHGITREQIEANGKPIGNVCKELNQFLGDSDVFSDAWTHDQTWVAKLYSAAKMTPTFTVRAIEYIMYEDQFKVWDNIKLDIKNELKLIRHRASSDAFLIQQTYMQSKKTVTKLMSL